MVSWETLGGQGNFGAFVGGASAAGRRGRPFRRFV